MMGGILRGWLAACALMAIAAPACAADAPLGRLFFTPSQRSSLDIARTQRARSPLAADRTDESATTSLPQTLTYEGAVRRSDGKATVFVNGRPMTEKGSAASSIVVGRVRPDGGVSLQLPQTGRTVDLKPGQSVELLSGIVEEGYLRRPAQPEAKPAVKEESTTKETKAPAEGKPAARERSRGGDEQRKIDEAIRTLQEAAGEKPAPGPMPPQSGAVPASPPRSN
jgi:hypothetical protein